MLHKKGGTSIDRNASYQWRMAVCLHLVLYWHGYGTKHFEQRLGG